MLNTTVRLDVVISRVPCDVLVVMWNDRRVSPNTLHFMLCPYVALIENPKVHSFSLVSSSLASMSSFVTFLRRLQHMARTCAASVQSKQAT